MTEVYQAPISMPDDTVVECKTSAGPVLASKAAGEMVRGCCGGGAEQSVWVTPQAGGAKVVATGWRPAP